MPRPTLRMIVVVVAGITGMKVWAQDRYHRAIYHEALLEAYQERARLTCLKAMNRAGSPASSLRLSDAVVVIGSPNARVALWDYENPLWDVRYRHPHILLSSTQAGERRCVFDMVAGLASVEQLAP